MSRPPRYIASVPVFQHYLTRLQVLLDVAEAAGDPSLLDARLAPDMLPFRTQVEVAANFVLRTSFPLAGLPVPPFGDFPASFAGLRERLAHVGTLISALEPARFVTEPPIEDAAGQARLKLPPDEFLHQYALPNFFFHLGAAYNILRHRGLPVGKATFDGYHVYAG